MVTPAFSMRSGGSPGTARSGQPAADAMTPAGASVMGGTPHDAQRAGDLPDDARLLSAEDVARAASVSLRSVREWIASGDLPVVRIGRCVRVRLPDWRRFLEVRRSA